MKQDLSLSEVGRLFDPPITRAAVAQWETTQRGTLPGIEHLAELARAYGATIDELVHGPRGPPITVNADDTVARLLHEGADPMKLMVALMVTVQARTKKAKKKK